MGEVLESWKAIMSHLEGKGIHLTLRTILKYHRRSPLPLRRSKLKKSMVRITFDELNAWIKTVFDI